jgi:hypothetical protein
MAAPGAGNLNPNGLVARVGGPLPAPGVVPVAAPAAAALGGGAAAAAAPSSPERRSFTGYLGETFNHGVDWTMLYVDSSLESWLLIETDGIVARETIPRRAGSGSPAPLDVIWVLADAAVGRGGRSLTLEGAFLSGNFTRAGDFEASPTGGTLAASTGVFCEARSAGCCKGCTAYTR